MSGANLQASDGLVAEAPRHANGNGRLRAALSYARERGWSVLPLDGKQPLTEHGVHDATTDPDVIEAWWRRWPDANVGLATGRGLFVVDVDGSVQALAESVASVEAGGATVIGIGIGDHTVDQAYSRHRVVDRPDQLARAMIDGTRLALRRSLGLSGMDTWWLRASEFENKERSVA